MCAMPLLVTMMRLCKAKKCIYMHESIVRAPRMVFPKKPWVVEYSGNNDLVSRRSRRGSGPHGLFVISTPNEMLYSRVRWADEVPTCRYGMDAAMPFCPECE